LLNAWASSKPPPAAEDRETLKYSEIITFRWKVKSSTRFPFILFTSALFRTR
jgi:hypothetical protein